MREYFKKLSSEIQGLISKVRAIAEENNSKAYLVGGFVRDLILRKPNLDLDIVVEGDGIKFAEQLAAQLGSQLIRHKRFGTATIILGHHQKLDTFGGVLLRQAQDTSPKDTEQRRSETPPFPAERDPARKKIIERDRAGKEYTAFSINPRQTTVFRPWCRRIDIASARKESYPQPASLPVVEKGSLKDDLFRRDFSINAMAISINKGDFGSLIDLFAGRPDLSSKKIRVLHKASFIDDPTRIYRAVRFEQRYNFRIEPQTLSLLKQAVARGMLDETEPQRMRDELILSLKEDLPLKNLKRLQGLNALSIIKPGLLLTKTKTDLFARVKKELSWFDRACPKHRKVDTWLIYFMVLLDGISVSRLKKILKRLVLRKGEEKRILDYRRLDNKIIRVLVRKENKPSKIFSLLEPLSYEVILLLKAKSQGIQKKYIQDFFRVYHGMRLHINGDDLRKLGVSPGPSYKKIFDKVLSAKINAKVKTRQEELKLAEKIFRKR